MGRLVDLKWSLFLAVLEAEDGGGGGGDAVFEKETDRRKCATILGVIIEYMIDNMISFGELLLFVDISMK